MTTRAKITGLLFGLLLSFTASCMNTEPGELMRRDGPIAGINPDTDGPDEVLKALGPPASKANGWWMDEHRFEMDYRVWYYKGVGRVIFDRYTSHVVATEADKTQGGLPN